LQRKGELDWFLSVRYYCKLTGAISCSQEAYIHHLLVKYGMMPTLCKLPMNPGAGLDSLPILDNPDKLVHAYAALIWESYFHCHQYRTTAPLLYELPYSLHLQRHACSSLVCQNMFAPLSTWYHSSLAFLVISYALVCSHRCHLRILSVIFCLFQLGS